MKNKSMCVREIAEAVERIAPVSLQEPWDNSGLTIGFEDRQVKNLLTCLEVDEKVAGEALKEECEMIVSHHPLIFSEVKSICDSETFGKTMMELIANGISVYSCHTPFDKVKGGNNDYLAKRIGLVSVKNMNGNDGVSPEKAERTSEADLGRIGKLKGEISLADMMLRICDALELRQNQIRVAGSLDKMIKTVGICTGAGAEFFRDFKKQGCDLMITGDVKYHQAREALAMGLCLIDAGHYGTEKSFAENMKEKLERETGGRVNIIASRENLEPFVW